ncbi:MAG: tRNA pseudouridine(55) synthase TruB [Isosphaeraceae bacterium]
MNVNKPQGVTSRAVVDRVARLIGQAKAGHAGTLDPLATGVLVVCVGPATRLVDWIQRLPKTYRTVILLGARSDTLDADGRIEYLAAPTVPPPEAIQAAILPLLGETEQMPPDYSALKVKGRRAYDLARAGQSVELAPRCVRIDRIAVVDYQWPRLELEVDCGAGTYIRSIARDVGEALGCGGLVETLIRTRIGSFTLEHAVNLDELSAESLADRLQPPLDALADLPRLRLDPDQVAAVTNGRRLNPRDFPDPDIPAGEVALLDPEGRLLALAESNPSEGWIQPRKVFSQ